MPTENEFKIIGETRDDAAGEAYAKVGRCNGLKYPRVKQSTNLLTKVKTLQVPTSNGTRR